MRKVLLAVSFCLVLSLCFVSTTFAAGTVTESPNVKIVIDGKIGTYDDVPIIINSRTMLPLRALLVDLGVQNDNQHIIWNAEDKSIIIKKESKNIFLKVNNNTAQVDGTSVALDAAPVIYKNKTYIPAKFIAQSLGKKVVWDGYTTTVLIRDESDYNKVKEILDKSTTAGKSANRFKFKTEAGVSIKTDDKSNKASVSAITEFDKQKKVIHITTNTNLSGQGLIMEAYMGNNTIFMKDTIANKWNKIEMPANLFDQAYENQGALGSFNFNDALYAGLIIDNSSNSNEIVLKGDVFMDELFRASGANRESGMLFNKFFMELTIDKNTYLTKKAYMEFYASIETLGKGQQISEKINCTYSDYNGNFQVVIPEEAKAALPVKQ